MRLQRVAQVLNEVLRLLVSALFLEADNQIGRAAAVVWKKGIDCLINLLGFLPPAQLAELNLESWSAIAVAELAK